MVKDAPMLSSEKIGPNTSLTPEGFLICKDVPIARTGVMIYGADEIPVEPGSDGVIYVTRPEEEVFKAESMASFEGKPVTNLHPSELVTPESWKTHVVGSVHNVRRNENRLVADLLIADKEAIEAVQAGLREVSCGYDASYEQDKPGYATQRDIVGNHVALVPQGRCGPSCAISDSKPKEIGKMAKKKSIFDRIKKAFASKDEKELDKALDELEEGGEEKGRELHVHLHGQDNEEEEGEPGEEWDTKQITSALRELMEDKHVRDARDSKMKDDFNGLVEELMKKGYSKEYATKIAGKVAKEKGDDAVHKDADDPDDDKTEYSGDSMPILLSRTEILSPGLKLRVPTGDAKSKEFRQSIRDCKRQALKAAYATDQGRAAVDAILSGRCIDTLSPATLDAVFMGASALMGEKNNQSTSSQKRSTKDFGVQTKITDINKANRDFWASRTGK